MGRFIGWVVGLAWLGLTWLDGARNFLNDEWKGDHGMIDEGYKTTRF